MVDTQMKALVWAKKLKERRAQLKKERPARIAKYDAAVKKWKRELVEWIELNAHDRIQNLTKTELKEQDGNRRYSGHLGFSKEKFFLGCPVAPLYPSDKVIREIDTILRHLAITEQETVRVTLEDTRRILGPQDGEDTDD